MKKTKLAYKTVKNDNENKVAAKVSANPAVATIANVLSFMLVSKVKLCFRECAKIVKIGEETGCLIEIASGTKSGTSASILSLVNLEIGIDKSLVLTVKGEHKENALVRVSKVINGTDEEVRAA